MSTTASPSGSTTRRAPTRARSRFGFGLVWLFALAVASYSIYLYATSSLAQLAEDGLGLGSTYESTAPWVQTALYTHIVSSSIALVIGPFQFVKRLRDRAPRVHRWMGKTYVGSVIVGALSGIAIAPSSRAGFVGLFGFTALAVLWIITDLRAIAAIRRRDVRSHEAWMIRNYALTFAAPTLRLWLGVLIALQITFSPDPGSIDVDDVFDTAYAVVPFLAWLPNIVVAEWLIRRRGLPAYRIS